MKKFLSASVVATMTAVGTTAALAHHSSAMFDYSHYVTVEGTIKSYSYQSPHAWISILGNEQGKKGEPRQWDVEAVAPVMLMAIGITKETYKPGDKVTITLYPLRDGRRAGSLINITNEQGKTLGSKLPPKDALAIAPPPPAN